MRLEYYPKERLKRELIAIIDRHLGPAKYQIFFFGSRVTGKSSERSDIDIGIEGNAPVPPTTLLDIKDEIEILPTLYSIELVDFHRVAQKFRDVVGDEKEYITPLP